MPLQDVEILRAACCIAGVDGRVCQQEHPLLKRLAEKAGVGAASLREMIRAAERDRHFFEEQFEIVKTDPEKTIRALLAVAVADRDISVDERVIIAHFATKLGMEEAHFDQLLASAQRAGGG